jgi:hypothetical protein
MADGSTQDLRERVAKLEALLGVPVEGFSSSTLCEHVTSLKATLDQHSAEFM